MGSVIERLFGTATTQLLHQLSGNTQATKQPRQMTRDVDPRRLAVWTLERFAARFCEYAYEVYDQMDHPALGQSPREAFAQGMQFAGMRTHRLIPYSEEFLILTCPTTRTKYARLDAARGVVVNGLRYYHLLMRFSKEVGSVVHIMTAPKPARAKLGTIDWFKMRQVAEQALIRALVKAVFADEGHHLM